MTEQLNVIHTADLTVLAPASTEVEQVHFNVEQQAELIQVTPAGLNEKGKRYAVVGGNVSQLPERAWKIVRTEAFKHWFGDWEHIPVEKFKTAQGSIYTYNGAGKTTRFKTATGEQHETQDITVFADMPLAEQGEYLTILYGDEMREQAGGKTLSVRLGEKLASGRGRVINTRAEISSPNALAIVILNGRQPDGTFAKENVEQARRVTLQPAVGLSTFDTRKFLDSDGQWKRELHLGNRVTEIKYADSNVSKALEKGEPRLFDDPRNPGVKCFIRSIKPYQVNRTDFRQWAEQFSQKVGRRETMMTALQEAGYDGIFVDGRPLIDSISGKMLFEDAQILPVAA